MLETRALGVSKVGMIDTIRTAASSASIAVFASKTGRLFNSNGDMIADRVTAFEAHVDDSATCSVLYSTYENC